MGWVLQTAATPCRLFLLPYSPLSPPPPSNLLSLTSSAFRQKPITLSSSLPFPTQPTIKQLQKPQDQDQDQELEEGEEEEEDFKDDPEEIRRRSLVLENIHRNRSLQTLINKLSRGAPMAGASFTSEELWAAVNFLIQANRHSDALHLFDEWRSISPSLSSPSNLSKMAQLLASAGAVAEASAIVAAIANTGLGPPPVSVYNAMIRALGKKKMFDELSKLVKTMRSGGPQPDAATFNLLIMIFAQGRLLRKMEEAHRTVLSRKMYLLPGSVAAMVEAYAELDRVSDMEKMYRRLLAYPVFQLQDDLIRKIAMAYIRNYKFSGLEELGNDVAARAGRSYVVWLLLLLGSGLFLSRRGMASVEREMGSAMVGSDISFVNIMALAHAKMKGFRDLEDLLLGFGKDGILKPDLITVGVVFDACSCGFDAGRVIDVWRRRGFLERKVVLETDPLVVAGFGKGNFVQNCEQLFSMPGHCAGDHDDDDDDDDRRMKEDWTYVDLIKMLYQSGKLGR